MTPVFLKSECQAELWHKWEVEHFCYSRVVIVCAKQPSMCGLSVLENRVKNSWIGQFESNIWNKPIPLNCAWLVYACAPASRVLKQMRKCVHYRPTTWATNADRYVLSVVLSTFMGLFCPHTTIRQSILSSCEGEGKMVTYASISEWTTCSVQISNI